jgi:hypothetical protein
VAGAVETELQGYSAAAERPGLRAVAFRLAELLDNECAVPQYPSAARVLVDVLDRLGKRAHGRGRLALVRQMTTPPA